MRKNTIASVSGLNVHHLSVEDIREAIDWRELSGIPTPTFNRYGLQSLVEVAVNTYRQKASCLNQRSQYWGSMPWNLASAGAPWRSLPPYKNFKIIGGVSEWAKRKGYIDEVSQKGNIVEYAARFAGWLKTAGSLEGIVQVIRHNVGPGMFSPYTVINPFRLFEKWNSPQRLERQIWKVRDRANLILSPYGLSVSWSSLGQAVEKHNSVGKAALWSAEWTVGEYLRYYDNRYEGFTPIEKKQHKDRFFFLKLARGLSDIKKFPESVQRWAVSKVFDGEFPSLREALNASTRLVEDKNDGVNLFLDPTTKNIIHGVEVTVGWLNVRAGGFGDNGKQFLLRQRNTGRTFHSYYFGDPKYAVKEAIRAWRRQVELEKKEADLVDFLRGERGFCPMVYRRQSYEAGNCERGTYAWLKGKGWEEKQFIPGYWLIPHLEESRVRNTAMALLRSFPENKTRSYKNNPSNSS